MNQTELLFEQSTFALAAYAKNLFSGISLEEYQSVPIKVARLELNPV